MIHPAEIVSIHPYFKAHPGKLDEVKAALSTFVEKTKAESKNVYYAFTMNGDVVYCREAYVGADGFLAHLANVGQMFSELMKIVDLQRFEVHGSAANLEKIKPHVAHLKVDWFTYYTAVER
jgi:quinol monooxygenase YgiN